MKKIQLKIGFSTLLHNLGSISPLSNPSGPAQTPPAPTSPHLRPQASALRRTRQRLQQCGVASSPDCFPSEDGRT